MLVELKKIREALEKAPTPAPQKGLWNEFKDFSGQIQSSRPSFSFRHRLVFWWISSRTR
jgi:hypothetical protein